MEIILCSTQDTKKLASEIAAHLHAGDVLALYGDLGVGKTTFVTYLTQALGISARVQSPTFVLHRNYLSKREFSSLEEVTAIKKVNHLDLYRLQSLAEIHDLGLMEILQEPHAVTVIEWPELAAELLPEYTISIKFEYLENDQRKVTLQNISGN